MKWWLISVLCLLLLACAKQKESNPNPPVSNPYPPPGNPATKTWLALGDSYTIGQSVPVQDRFPHQTVARLQTLGINIGTPDYIAVTGWTTNSLKNAIQAQNPQPHDVVSLLIGVNDQYQTHDTTGYRQRFTDLLTKAILLAKGNKNRVFVLSIPDYSVTPFGMYYDTARIRMEIDWFNAINKEVTELFQCPYLDITPISREALNDPSLIANDGLHPSGVMYYRWATELLPMMYAVLK